MSEIATLALVLDTAALKQGAAEASKALGDVGQAGAKVADQLDQGFKAGLRSAQEFASQLKSTIVRSEQQMSAAVAAGVLKPEDAAKAATAAGEQYGAALKRAIKETIGSDVLPDNIKAGRIAGLTAELGQIEQAATRAAPSFGRLGYSLTSFVSQMDGIPPVAGRVAYALGGFGIGQAAMIGIIAGVAALSEGWKLLTADLEKTIKTADDLADALKRAESAKRPGYQQALDNITTLQAGTTARGVYSSAYLGASTAGEGTIFGPNASTQIAADTKATEALAAAKRAVAEADREGAAEALRAQGAFVSQLATLEKLGGAHVTLAHQARDYYRALADDTTQTDAARASALGYVETLDAWDKVQSRLAKGDLAAALREQREQIAALNKEYREAVVSQRYAERNKAADERSSAPGYAYFDQYLDSTIPRSGRPKIQPTTAAEATAATQGDAALFKSLQDTIDQLNKDKDLGKALARDVHGAMAAGINAALQDGVLGGKRFWESFAQLGSRYLSETISKELDRLTKDKNGNATSFGKDAGAAIGGGLAGYSVGYATGNSTSGALGGAAAGALAGNEVLPGGLGAAIGALTGGIAGLIGAHKKAKEAAEQMAKAQEALAFQEAQRLAANAAVQADANRDISVRELRVGGQTDAADQLERLYALADAYAKLGAAQASPELVARMEAVTKAEWARADALKATQRAEADQDLTVRGLHATGQDGAGDALQLQLTQQREVEDAVLKGMSDDFIAHLKDVQAAETLRFVTEQRHAHDAAITDAQARTLTAEGRTREAESLRIAAQYEDELTAARKLGADVLLAVTVAQKAETAAREIAWQQQQAHAREDLTLRELTARGDTELVAAERRRIDHEREIADAEKAGYDAAYLAQLKYVQGLEDVAAAMAAATAAAEKQKASSDDITGQWLDAFADPKAAEQYHLDQKHAKQWQDALDAHDAPEIIGKLADLFRKEQAALDAKYAPSATSATTKAGLTATAVGSAFSGATAAQITRTEDILLASVGLQQQMVSLLNRIASRSGGLSAHDFDSIDGYLGSTVKRNSGVTSVNLS